MLPGPCRGVPNTGRLRMHRGVTFIAASGKRVSTRCVPGMLRVRAPLSLPYRIIAQPGRALRSGRRGRGFESR